MGLYRKCGSVARIDGMPFNSEACCILCPCPPCCCPPPSPFNGRITSGTPTFIETFVLTEATAEAGECRRYEGTVDLSAHGTCGTLTVRVTWAEGCTDESGITVSYSMDGAPFVPVPIEASSGCDPFCLLTELFEIAGCSINSFLELGCDEPPPPCCCPPEIPFYAELSSLIPSWTELMVLTEVGAGLDECLRMEGVATPPGCQEIGLRVIFPDDCTTWQQVEVWYRYGASIYQQLTTQNGTCEPLCLNTSIPLLNECADAVDVRLGCGVGPTVSLVEEAGYKPRRPSPEPPEPVRQDDLDRIVKEITEDDSEAVERWKRDIQGPERS